MQITFEQFRTHSPRLALLTGVLCYATFAWADEVYMNLDLFTLLFICGIILCLMTLCIAPFALITVWNARDSFLRHLRIPTFVRNIDWTAAGNGTQIVGKSIGTKSLRQVDRLKSVSQKAMVHAFDMLKRVDWASMGAKSSWVLANIVVTLLPLLVIIIAVLVSAIVPRRGAVPPDVIIATAVFLIPFVFIAAVALKTKFNMPRIFNFSADFLHSFGKKIMIMGPILALAGAGLLIFDSGLDDEGWIILLAPIVFGGIIASACALGSVFLALGAITRWFQNKRAAHA